MATLAEDTTSTADEIVDFTSEQDTINLSAVDANSLLGGDQTFAFIGTAAFSDTPLLPGRRSRRTGTRALSRALRKRR